MTGRFIRFVRTVFVLYSCSGGHFSRLSPLGTFPSRCGCRRSLPDVATATLGQNLENVIIALFAFRIESFICPHFRVCVFSGTAASRALMVQSDKMKIQ